MKRLLFAFILFVSISAALYSTQYLIGIYYHDVDGMFSGHKTESGYDFDACVLFGDDWLKTHIGITINSAGYTNKIYQGFTIETDRSKLFGSLHAGIAVHWGTIRNLGNRMLFRVALEAGYKSVSIVLDHISNANLYPNNAGLDLIGLRYRF